MLKAQLYHLLLEFNTLYKPNLFQYYNISNCSISLLINIDPIKILTCDHTYHKSYYINNKFKCIHYLLFLQNNIDEHI